jgi:NAD(P)H-dependent FMN reductase
MINLKVILSTVRPGRKGPIVGSWIAGVAKAHGSFEVEILDLAVINLPMMDEEQHPSLRQYEHEHTKGWSKSIEEADAFIFVTAEYDFNYPAPLRNALEYLVHEWAYKAAGIVSYGGVSAGTRAANSLKGDLASLKVVPLTEMVNLPFFSKGINENGVLLVNEVSNQAAATMLNELERWTRGLRSIKANKQDQMIHSL